MGNRNTRAYAFGKFLINTSLIVLGFIGVMAALSLFPPAVSAVVMLGGFFFGCLYVIFWIFGGQPTWPAQPSQRPVQPQQPTMSPGAPGGAATGYSRFEVYERGRGIDR